MSPGAALGAMTLGQLTKALWLPADPLVWVGSGRYRPLHLVSYRGYYKDLALLFDANSLMIHASALKTIFDTSIGHIFDGYKGGGRIATYDTAVWVTASPSEAYGNAVVAVEPRPGGYELVVRRIDP